MKLVINHTKKESFLFNDNKMANPKVAYSFAKNSKKAWNFTHDTIHMREYSNIDAFLDKLIRKKYLSF